MLAAPRVCPATDAALEDASCSNSVAPTSLSVDDHRTYFGTRIQECAGTNPHVVRAAALDALAEARAGAH